MPIIECNDKFNLGIEVVDHCHKKLIDCINTAFDEFSESGQIQDIDSLVKTLTDHAAQNLAYEEKLLGETSYPGLVEHRKEHELFAEAVGKLRGVRQLNEASTVELLWFLVGWITQHVRGSDVEFSQYLLARKADRDKTG